MKIRFAIALIRYCAWLILPGLVILPGIISCSTYHVHHKNWIGVFMFDSVTAGAVLLEYDESSPKGNTFGNGDQYNVNVDLFRYDFAKQILTRDRRLFKDLKDAVLYRVTEFNPPHLMQGAPLGQETAIFNLETGEKKVLGIRVSHFSQSKRFYSDVIEIIDSNKVDTLIRTSPSAGPAIYFYSEGADKYVNMKSDNSNGKRISYFQVSPIKPGTDVVLVGLPRVYFSNDFFVNWEENVVPFYSLYPDSASVGCDIDSLLLAGS